MVVTISVIVVIIVVGVGILAFRFRTEKGIESGITSFRRELHALAPRPGERDAAPTARPTADPRGVTIVSGEADVAMADDAQIEPGVPDAAEIDDEPSADAGTETAAPVAEADETVGDADADADEPADDVSADGAGGDEPAESGGGDSKTEPEPEPDADADDERPDP